MYYKTTVMRVCEVTDLKSEVKFDLRGHLEATMASKVMKIAFIGNMHLPSRVIEVTELNFEVKSEIEDIWMPEWPRQRCSYLRGSPLVLSAFP